MYRLMLSMIRCWFVAAVLFGLVLQQLARGATFDAERDLGLVANNPAPNVAARNTALLSAALDAQWEGGKFKFADGHVGPILYPIQCAAKQFFFAGTITTSKRIGGILYGAGGNSYMMTEAQYQPGGVFGGMVTRFSRIDGDKGGPVFRMRGTGFILENVSIYGRRWPGGKDDPFVGVKAEACIEVEGRAFPATGCHTIRNCQLGQAKYGIRTIPGYYDDKGTFVKDENHADQGVVQTVYFSGVESCFRSENQQAVGWSFRDIHSDVDAHGGDVVIFDLVRGGDIDADNLLLNHTKVTLIRVHDFSHNNRRLACNMIRYDGTYFPGSYFTLFKYDGPVLKGQDMSWLRWSVRVTGDLPGGDAADAKKTFDPTKLIQINDAGSKVGIERKDLLFDIAGMPKTGFVSAGGPWWRPK